MLINFNSQGLETKWKWSRSVMSDSWDSLDCSPPGSSVHGISQARILEWVAISFSRGLSQPRDWTWVSWIAGRFFAIWATRKEPKCPSIDEWIKKMYVCIYIHTYLVECYSAIKRWKLAIGIKWMNLEDTTLGETSQREQDKYSCGFCGPFPHSFSPLCLCRLCRFVPRLVFKWSMAWCPPPASTPLCSRLMSPASLYVDLGFRLRSSTRMSASWEWDCPGLFRPAVSLEPRVAADWSCSKCSL